MNVRVCYHDERLHEEGGDASMAKRKSKKKGSKKAK